LNPAQLIFGSKDQYTFGVRVTINSALSSATASKRLLGQYEPQDLRHILRHLELTTKAPMLEPVDLWSENIPMVGLLSAFIGILLGLVVGRSAGYLGKVVE